VPRNRLKDDGKERGGRPGPLRERPEDSNLAPEGYASPATRAIEAFTRPLSVLEEITEPGAGRYSVNRDLNGVAYHKWRYSSGQWAGHYIMYVGDKYHTIGQGLLGLEVKLAMVAAGLLKPTLDKYK
jgi:hypothetical protein